MEGKTPPLPKPRTKFTVMNTTQFPESPTPERIVNRLNDALEPQQHVRPPVPPPPLKPPRSYYENTCDLNSAFGNVLEQLKTNLGEKMDSDKPGCALSPPSREAPAPPRPPPPPPGWKIVNDGQSQFPEAPLPAPPVPERTSSGKLPVREERCNVSRPPSFPPPTLEQALSLHKDAENSVYIENPIYMSLSEFQKNKLNGTNSEVHSVSAMCGSSRTRYETLTEMTNIDKNEKQLYPSIEDSDSRDIARKPPITTSPDSGLDELSPNTATAPSLYSKEPVTAVPGSSPNYSLSLETSVLLSPEVNTSQLNAYTPSPQRSDYEDLLPSRDLDDSQTSLTKTAYTKGSVEHSEVYLLDSGTSDAVTCATTETDCSQNLLESGESPSVRIIADGSSVSFFGYVWTMQGKKERRLHCILRDKSLMFYEDEDSEEPVHGTFKIWNCIMIRPCSWKKVDENVPSTSTSENNLMDAIQLTFQFSDKKTVTFRPEDSVQTWLMFLAEVWLSETPQLAYALSDLNLHICGNIWIKQGTASEWTTAVSAVRDTKWCYILNDNKSRTYEVDVRTILALRETLEKDDWCKSCKYKGQQRGAFMITVEGCSLYLETSNDGSTQAWFETFDNLLKRPVTRLEDFRLTCDDVPIAIEKCMKFVSTFGLKSEGIYRRNGRIVEAREIMKNLMEDPVGFHLIQTDQETVYAVADVLRQIFRRLSTPLIPKVVHQKLFALCDLPPSDKLWESYGNILVENLHVVYYQTLKKLISHLKVVNEHSMENRASVDNLGKVFGASIFHTDNEDQAFVDHSRQISVIVHLITNYDHIFKVRAEGLLVPVYMWAKKDTFSKKKSLGTDSSYAENLSFNAKTTLAAEEVCNQVIRRPGFKERLDANYALFEVVRNGTLRRRMLPQEKLSSVVLDRWLEWKCTDAWLLFDHDTTPFTTIQSKILTGKVKLADPGSKTFKSCELKVEELETAHIKINAYRGGKLWRSWSLKETAWYSGAEPSRKAPFEFNATMLFTTTKGMSPRLPGVCVSFQEQTDRTLWLDTIEYNITGRMPATLVHI